MSTLQQDLEKIELHNFAGAEEAKEFHGIALHRFPEKMRHFLRAYSPICGEIRFVTEAPEVKVFLGFLSPNVKQTPIRVFQGNFERELPTGFSLDNGKVTVLSLSAKTMLNRMNFEEMHTQTVLTSMRSDALPNKGFSPNVWRIQFDQTPTVYFCGLDTGGHPCRKPLPEEKPNYKYLSLSGSVGQFGLDVYNATAARRLGLDLWNFGMAGRNLWQPEYADYVASVDNFDIVTFMYGMNVIPHTPGAEIRRRMRYMLTRLTEKRPERPVLGIPTYPCNLDRLIDPEADPYYRPYLELKEIFREVMEEFSANANVHLIPGESLMDDPCGIYCDGLHLSTYAQVLFGIRLAERMRPFLPENPE